MQPIELAAKTRRECSEPRAGGKVRSGLLETSSSSRLSSVRMSGGKNESPQDEMSRTTSDSVRFGSTARRKSGTSSGVDVDDSRR